jgi:hypothetical protein
MKRINEEGEWPAIVESSLPFSSHAVYRPRDEWTSTSCPPSSTRQRQTISVSRKAPKNIFGPAAGTGAVLWTRRGLHSQFHRQYQHAASIMPCWTVRMRFTDQILSSFSALQMTAQVMIAIPFGQI